MVNKEFEIKIAKSFMNVKKDIDEIKEILQAFKRLNGRGKRLNAFKRQENSTIDLKDLTMSEKVILKVFYSYKNMSLSYDDIAKELNKSSAVIKCHVNQLKRRGNILIEEMIEKRKRYKLNPHLEVKNLIEINV